ncbi:MAG: SUMF1/EgtB/PvdO family nonheme iron enzyme [Planctomycetes bacterium]|nr:SUMF1/EgtB/PvdO family nonheme iron enzyme [Planctomycetota bacterium]
MSRLSSIATFALALGAFGLGGMAWYQAWLIQPLDQVTELAPVAIGDVAGVAAEPGDVTFELSARDGGGNTELLWHCGKVLAGVRSDYCGAWRQLQGRLLIDPKAAILRAGELHVAVAAMRGHGEHPAPNALINTVRDNQWFLPEHPTAVLAVTGTTARPPGMADPYGGVIAGWTHVLRGELGLNGVQRDVEIPARLAVGADEVRLDAVIVISRAAYAVAGRRGVEPTAEVDDEVVIEVHVHATPDPLAVIVELNRELIGQQAVTGELRQQVAELSGRLDRAENALDELRREVKTLASRSAAVPPGAGGAGPGDRAALPPRFVDKVDYKNAAGDARMKDLGFEVPFEMVLVPGDPEQGIAPFYVQTTEVTWRMFRAWSYCEDIGDAGHAGQLKDALLRPSPCYDDASRGHGFEGRAALGVSRRNALAFCRFVSEQTGRSYRLWTDAEWHHVAALTGGLPADPKAIAWLFDNTDKDDFGDPLSMPVGKKPADRLGLHDFWGNVAEWVMADEQFVRGGSYLTSAAELALEWRENESQDVWNMTYPNTPKSQWWYRDRFDMGFRLVCDPIDLPGGR